jgi:hypothetical protein
MFRRLLRLTFAVSQHLVVGESCVNYHSCFTENSFPSVSTASSALNFIRWFLVAGITSSDRDAMIFNFQHGPLMPAVVKFVIRQFENTTIHYCEVDNKASDSW